MGGQQVLEWSIMDPDLIEQSVIIAAGASLNAWSRGWNAAQRLALEADPTLFDDSINAGAKGLEAARAMGMLCYRTYEAYNELQVDHPEALENFRIESYLRYQGSKLSKRFTATAYWSVCRSMDTHHVGRGRGGVEAALGSISADSLVIGIQSDILFPINEQIEIANYIPNAQLEIIDSPYGHDGFLIEDEKLTSIIDKFMKKEAYHAKRPTARLEAA
jgi:homoserine O-acetyltransferase